MPCIVARSEQPSVLGTSVQAATRTLVKTLTMDGNKRLHLDHAGF
jgi:hypothetical protein